MILKRYRKRTKTAETEKVRGAQRRKETQENFRETISNIEKILSYNQETERSIEISIYNFCIKALVREVASASACQLLHGGNCPHHDSFQIRHVKSYKTENIGFENLNVLSCVWEPDRWLGAIKTITKQGFRQSFATDYTGTLYEELDLIVITGGIHHASLASLINSGSAKVQFVRLSDYYNILSTDGMYWYCDDDTLVSPAEVGDYRMAVLYELSRRRALLAADTTLLTPTDAPIPKETCKYYDNYLAAQNEKNFYRRENELLMAEIAKLKLQLQNRQVADDSAQ